MAISPRSRFEDPSLENSRAIDAQRRAVNEQRHSMATARTMQRQYRRAVRHGDLKAISVYGGAMAANGINPTGGGGITNALQQQETATLRANGRAEIGDRMFNTLNLGGQGDANDVGRQVEEQKKPHRLVNPNARPLQGSQRAAGQSQQDWETERAGPVYAKPPAGTVDKLPEGSTGGMWVNVGPSATDPAQSAPAANASARNGNSALSELQRKRNAVQELKGQWSYNEAVGTYAGKEGQTDVLKYAPTKAQLAQEAVEERDSANNNFSKGYGEWLAKNPNASRQEKDAEFARQKAANPKFGVTQSAKDKTAWTAYDAKVRAAEKSGYEGDVTASTNFGEEAKALIPGAKKEIQDIIDQRDAFRDNNKGMWRRYALIRDRVTGSDGKTPWSPEKAKQESDNFNNYTNGIGYIGHPSDEDENFQSDTGKLKAFRGAPAYSEAQAAVVAAGSDISGLGGQDLDPVTPSGNPLFDNPNGPSDSWVKTPTGQPKQAKSAIANPRNDEKNYKMVSPHRGAPKERRYVGPDGPAMNRGAAEERKRQQIAKQQEERHDSNMTALDPSTF